MNETFQLRRFWQYFRFDFMQVMRSHGRPLLLFAGLGLFYFLVQGLLSLSFSGTWSYPGHAVRIGMFIVVCTVMELYIARIYGHLTDPQRAQPTFPVATRKGALWRDCRGQPGGRCG